MNNKRSTKNLFVESLVMVSGAERDDAKKIADFLSKNQIIRPICNESLSFKSIANGK